MGRYMYLLHQGCAPPALVLILFTIYFLPATLVAHKVIRVLDTGLHYVHAMAKLVLLAKKILPMC